MIRYLDMRAKKYEQQQQQQQRQTPQQQLWLQRQLLLQQQKMLPLRAAACGSRPMPIVLCPLAACNCQVCCLLKSFVLGPTLHLNLIYTHAVRL